MSIKTILCPKCGKKIEDSVNNLCIECFLEKADISIPSRVSIKFCVKCEAILMKNIWKKPLNSVNSIFESELKQKIKVPHPFILEDVTIKDFDEGIFSMLLSKDNLKIEVEDKTNFVLQKVACPECSREKKKYISKIQIRFFSNVKKNKAELDKFMRQYYKKIIKIEEFERGFDYHFSNDSLAVDISRKLSRKFKSKVKETFELFSWDKLKNRPRKRRILMLKCSGKS